MVVSSVDWAEPPVMKLPSSAKRRLIRPVDGSLHLCELEIELRRLGRRLGLQHIGRGDIIFVAARVECSWAMVLPCISFSAR